MNVLPTSDCNKDKPHSFRSERNIASGRDLKKMISSRQIKNYPANLHSVYSFKCPNHAIEMLKNNDLRFTNLIQLAGLILLSSIKGISTVGKMKLDYL